MNQAIDPRLAHEFSTNGLLKWRECPGSPGKSTAQLALPDNVAYFRVGISSSTTTGADSSVSAGVNFD